MGPGDLSELVLPLVRPGTSHEAVLVGPETSDDAGVYRYEDSALVATADFITPVCDDPVLFGRIAAANSLSDIYAMGGRPLFALNLCCFPEKLPRDAAAGILRGAAETLAGSGAALLGGHSVEDRELKFGLAVVGDVAPDRVLSNRNARPGDRLLLTKPLGTGVLINAFKARKLDDAGFAAALAQMARLNDSAAALALARGVRAATDVTGFGLAGHALNLARGSEVGLRVRFDELPVHDLFYRMVAAGVATGATDANAESAWPRLDLVRDLSRPERHLIFDPQTSGGLLLAVPAEEAGALLHELLEIGHVAAEVGEILPGPARLEIV